MVSDITEVDLSNLGPDLTMVAWGGSESRRVPVADDNWDLLVETKRLEPNSGMSIIRRGATGFDNPPPREVLKDKINQNRELIQ